eukprot:1657864-Amphidinium_carterae.1
MFHGGFWGVGRSDLGGPGCRSRSRLRADLDLQSGFSMPPKNDPLSAIMVTSSHGLVVMTPAQHGGGCQFNPGWLY